jgi:MerR family mercuric resistance operon transcriptional regulator
MAASTPATSEPLTLNVGISVNERANQFDGGQSRVRTVVRSQGVQMMAELTIGRLADEAGVNVETIRYYQRRGLMTEPDKPISGHRRYAADAIKRVHFIKRAQVLGFTLEEISSLLELDEARACADTRELAARKLEVIENKLADLKAMRKALIALLRQCDTGTTKGRCPIIHALAAD